MEAKVIRINKIDGQRGMREYIVKTNNGLEQSIKFCPNLIIGSSIEIMELRSYSPDLPSGIGEFIFAFPFYRQEKKGW